MKWETFIDQLQENWSDNFNKKSKNSEPSHRVAWKSRARAFLINYFTSRASDINDNRDPNALRAKIYFYEGNRAKQEAKDMKKAIKEQKLLYKQFKKMKAMYPATPEDPNPAAVETAREHLINAVLARHPEFVNAKNAKDANTARNRLKRAISVASIASKLTAAHSKQASTASQSKSQIAVHSLSQSMSMPHLFDGKTTSSKLTLATIDDENKRTTSPLSPSMSTAAPHMDEDKKIGSHYRSQPLSMGRISLERVASPSLSRLTPMERIVENKATSLPNLQIETASSEKEDENTVRERQARTGDVRRAMQDYLESRANSELGLTKTPVDYASPYSAYTSTTSSAAKAATSPRIERSEAKSNKTTPKTIKMPTFYNVIGLNILNPFYWGAMITNRVGAGLGFVAHGIAKLINTAFGETRQNGIAANVCKAVFAGPFFAAHCVAFTVSKIFGAGGLRDTWRALTKKPNRRNTNVEEAVTPRRSTLSSLRQEQRSNIEMTSFKNAPAKKAVYPATVGPIRGTNAIERLHAQTTRTLDALNLADEKHDLKLKAAKPQSANTSTADKTALPGTVLEASPRPLRPVMHRRKVVSAGFFARNNPRSIPLPPLPSVRQKDTTNNQSARLKTQPSTSTAAPSISLTAVKLK